MSSSLVELRTRKCSTTHSGSRSSRMGQVERIRSHEVPVQEAAERHHEAKPRPENRGNQMGVHGEDHQGKPDYKARLVVQGCQEDKCYIRTDAPTGSRDAFFMTLSEAAQSGWDYSVYDAQSAYLQSDGIKRLLLLRILGRSQGKCLLLLVRSTGRETLDVRGTSTARKRSRQLVLWSQDWNKVFTTCMDHLDLRLLCTRMSTTFCLRTRKPPRNTRMLCNILCTRLI